MPDFPGGREINTQSFLFKQGSHIVVVLVAIVLGRSPLLELGVILIEHNWLNSDRLIDWITL
jgi:hypothetical protein